MYSLVLATGFNSFCILLRARLEVLLAFRPFVPAIWTFIGTLIFLDLDVLILEQICHQSLRSHSSLSQQ